MTKPRIKCFAINVAKNEYRREHILSQQDMVGYPIEIFSAVTPDTMVVDDAFYNDKRARRFTGRSLLPGEQACAQSHLKLWDNLLKDKAADYYLILEDDIEISQNLRRAIESISLSNVNLMKLSGMQKRDYKVIDKADCHELVRFAYGPLDAACYLISKKAAVKLLDYCRPVFTPVDIMMDRSYDHGVDIYGILPFPANNALGFDDKSQLYTDVGVRNRKYDQSSTLFERLCVKFHRIAGSVKRKIAKFKLRMNR